MTQNVHLQLWKRFKVRSDFPYLLILSSLSFVFVMRCTINFPCLIFILNKNLLFKIEEEETKTSHVVQLKEKEQNKKECTTAENVSQDKDENRWQARWRGG